MKVDGKVAIITGGARGMGASHARRLVKEGATVVVTDVLDAEGKALCNEIGSNAVFMHHDVSKAGDWTRVVSETEERFGGLDILVNNAAIGYLIKFELLDEEQFRRFFEVNQLSIFLGTKAVLDVMTRRGGGSIINISSVGGIVAGPDGFGYVASKFAVRGMTKSSAIDLASRNIRVNSVHPGMVQTAMLAGTDVGAQAAHVVPLGRVARPDEVSGAVLFLASDDSSYCTGSEIVVDGGWISQ